MLPLMQMVGNPKSIKKVIYSLVLVVVVVGSPYMIASGDPLTTTLENEPTAANPKNNRYSLYNNLPSVFCIYICNCCRWRNKYG